MTAFSPLANPAHKFRKEGQPNLLTEQTIVEIGETHKKVRNISNLQFYICHIMCIF